MKPLYIEATETQIRDRKHRYTHPVTGEVYGGSDYDNPKKLAEIGAVPLRDQAPAKGKVAEGWDIVKESDGFVRKPLKEVTPPEPEPLPYGELRRKEYPTIGDQLDAIWKHLNYRRMLGEEMIQEADDMLGDILSVKRKFPKPEEK